MGEVAEAHGGAAEVFGAAVASLCGAVAGSGTVDAGGHGFGPSLQGAAEGDVLGQRGGTSPVRSLITAASCCFVATRSSLRRVMRIDPEERRSRGCHRDATVSPDSTAQPSTRSGYSRGGSPTRGDSDKQCGHNSWQHK